DVAGPPDRDSVGAQTAVALRPSGNGLRPDRDLCNTDLDWPDLPVLLRLQVGPYSHCRVREHVQPTTWTARRPGPMGLPLDSALGDLRDSLRGALRPHDPGERDGDDE